VPAAKLQDAGDPSPAGEGTPDVLLVIVQTAAVPHQRTPRLDCDQLAKRSHAILPRHVHGDDAI
jgi:hypothetical protein